MSPTPTGEGEEEWKRMPQYRLRFEEITEAHRAEVGSKGYTLARLYQAGFPVPPGLIIPASAYQDFLDACGLESLLTHPQTTTYALWQAILTAEVPPALVQALRQAWDELPHPIAVRSSALGEDSDRASFAGQHDTFLDVGDFHALLTAIRGCWASLWNKEAVHYRLHRNEEVTSPAMAIILQPMVRAVWAGVAFTADPVTGRQDRLTIEVVEGSGEALVQGQATPDRYTVPVGPEGPRPDPDLPDEIRAVAELAWRVARWANSPQDIEWALDEEGRLHLLQARPITVLGSEEAESILWTRDNVGEVVPDPVTPLSWSVLDPLTNRAFAHLLHRLGIGDYPQAGLFGRFYGRVYFNQTLFQAMLRRFYVSETPWRSAPRLMLTGLRALWLLYRLPSEARREIRTIRTYRTQGCEIATWRRLIEQTMATHLGVTVMAELLHMALEKVLARWTDGEIPAAALTAGLRGVRSAEAGHALATLARRARNDPRLRQIILKTPVDQLSHRLTTTAHTQPFWEQFQRFLEEHGHSAAQEFELAAPRWRDDPTPVLAALRAQVAEGEQPSTIAPPSPVEAAIARVEAQLGLGKRWLFRRLLATARRFAQLRENLKYHFVMAYSYLRDHYLAQARQLIAVGRLTEVRGIFFLTEAEVEALIAGNLPPAEAGARIAHRLEEWRKARGLPSPSVLRQRPDGSLEAREEATSWEIAVRRMMQGVAASPGQVVGPARVVHNLDEARTLRPGEVLVAPAITPGWSPLLLTAGGLVTERGGILSHGAILAREYGRPAVLNVPQATRRLRTGQRLRVDGSRGVVEVLHS